SSRAPRPASEGRVRRPAFSPPATSSSPPLKASAPSTPTSSTGAPTMTAELEVAYLGVQVADPTGFGTFLRDIVGLIPGKTTADGATTWRDDDRVHRIFVE